MLSPFGAVALKEDLSEHNFGYCFNAAEWIFADSPLRGACARQEVYVEITSWKDFDAWLLWIETFRVSVLRNIAAQIQPTGTALGKTSIN